MSPSPAKSRASAGARSQNRSLAPADKLKREIQAVLTDELAQDQYRTGQGKFDGFAYVAAEAYFHLGGGYDAGLQPMQLKHRGKSHWWLLDPAGRVVDLTLGPRETSKLPVPPRQAPPVPLHARPGSRGGRRRSWSGSAPPVAEGHPGDYSGMAMERSRWTDERLDDLAGGIGNRFDQVDKRFDQVDNRFAQVDKRFDRVDREFDRVHEDIRELRQWIFRLTIGMSVGFISVLSAILVRGA